MGTIRVELNRPGLPALSDERPSQIVPTPPARPAARAVTLPPFDHRLVEGADDPLWATLAWPDNINGVASSAEMENGTLMIYYSAVFPRYAGRSRCSSGATRRRRAPSTSATKSG